MSRSEPKGRQLGRRYFGSHGQGGSLADNDAALDEEVNGFLGREQYKRSEEFRGYRNGYHSNGGSLEDARAIAAHESSQTTRFHDRTGDKITLDEIERIRF